jgi:hypothetical protein
MTRDAGGIRTPKMDDLVRKAKARRVEFVGNKD